MTVRVLQTYLANVATVNGYGSNSSSSSSEKKVVVALNDVRFGKLYRTTKYALYCQLCWCQCIGSLWMYRNEYR